MPQLKENVVNKIQIQIIAKEVEILILNKKNNRLNRKLVLISFSNNDLPLFATPRAAIHFLVA